MIESLYIAWQYVIFNKVKTAVLVACVTLIASLPLALQLLLAESERQLLSRAVTTPLVAGARGSALDLVMNSLYFDDEIPELISMQASQQVMESGLADPIPLYIRFRARGFPVVGTTLDYFDFHGLGVGKGRMMAMLGECVIGASVAEHLGLGPGDSLVTSPENLFDLAGVYPLKMKVVGVLEPAHAPDDLGVFVDLKTAWVVQGLGHGHEDLARTRDTSVILKRTDQNVVANAKLIQFTEITEANIDSFHFHGDLPSYPVTALIAVPHDAKSGTLLRGRYLEDREHQIVQPKAVVDGLLENIFRIKSVLDAVIMIVGLATVLAIVLVFSLSLRLRKGEINTIFKLGGSRLTIARLLGAEIAIIGIASALLCVGMLLVANHYSSELVRVLFVS
ncbi:MAG: ABC transporter permease [Pseudomonadota bacterium]|nr:MAG: ABC transporter permease [Pseudomonadota bacterium]